MSERDVIEARWEMSRRDPLCFARWFCFTLDQHDSETPVKPFPAERPHIIGLTRLWQCNPVLFVPKSRQMIVSWWASMLADWCLLFGDGNLVYQQSKRLEDVVGNEHTGDGLMGRSKFMLNHIPYRDWVIPKRSLVVKSESVTYLPGNAAIVAIAQGGDKIRSHTVTGLETDETAFQPEFDDAYTAAMSSIRRGWLLGVTTPDMKDGGQSMRIALDLPDP